MSEKKNMSAKLKELRENYARQLPEKAGQLAELWRHYQMEMTDRSALEQVVRGAHTLAGSAASFGFIDVSSAARTIENLLKPRLAEGSNPDGAEALQATEALAELESGCRDAACSDAHIPADTEQIGVAEPETSLTPSRKIVFLVEDDTPLLKNLALQIGHYGYDVRAFASLEEMRREMRKTVPSAVIMDIVFPEGRHAGTDLIEDLQRGLDRHLPVIFISANNDIETRLQAVRAGGDAYFIKPLSVAALVDKLDILTSDKEAQEPYRILIVDDDPDLANYNSLLLQHAGMTTAIENNPLNVMTTLIEFKPDLILMDMYMPQCNGLELAQVIRQMGSFLSIPIVFLSAETDLDKQLSALQTGGDDFLTKPIRPEHLISSIVTRAERMRIIRSFMERDGLTGLLNHTRTKEHLAVSVERVRRQKSSLAFAMIDIDRFKSINDTYGHPTGDRVIVSLARLLQQRLRKTDIIGRFGGEEFAVVLNDTDVECAERVMNEIRGSFEKITHQFEETEFTVSFSCGIAMSRDYHEAAALINAADKGLYQAKNGGRNRVVMTGPE